MCGSQQYLIVANLHSEKYLKKIIGIKEMEDALKRLDKLMQEEARMAAAENLKLMLISAWAHLAALMDLRTMDLRLDHGLVD